MGRRGIVGIARAAVGAVVVAALFTRVADARLWTRLAPDPLASDSSYTELLARPSDSLTASQLSWLAVQRDWRIQRKVETDAPTGSITESGHAHRNRPSDKKFAALASQPYAALADTDRAWLVAENAAQRVGRETQSDGLGAGGFLLFALVALALVSVAAAVSLAKMPFGPF